MLLFAGLCRMHVTKVNAMPVRRRLDSSMLQMLRHGIRTDWRAGLAALALLYLLVLQSILVMAVKTQIVATGSVETPYAILCTAMPAGMDGDRDPVTLAAHGLDCCILCRIVTLDAPALISIATFNRNHSIAVAKNPFRNESDAETSPLRASYPVQPRAPPPSGDILARA